MIYMPRQLNSMKLSCLSVVILLVGCADLNGLAPQGQLRSGQTIAASTSLAGVAPAPWPERDWWHGLGDAALDTLIGEAMRDNPDLAAADARVRLATAQAGSAEAARYPTLDAKASFPGTPFPDDFPKPFAGYTSAKQANLTASYTFDLWGGQRAAWEAALGQQRGEAAQCLCGLLDGNVIIRCCVAENVVLRQLLLQKVPEIGSRPVDALHGRDLAAGLPGGNQKMLVANGHERHIFL